METDVRAWRDKSEYKNICKRLADKRKKNSKYYIVVYNIFINVFVYN